MLDRFGFIKAISGLTLFPSFESFSVLGHSRETKTNSFADSWEFVGYSIHEPGYHVWGASPVFDTKGKVHLYAARWPKEHHVDPGWRSHSEIAHYISNSPEGPFVFSDIAIKGTGHNTWDRYGIHNPTIHYLDNQFVLLYIANNDYRQPPHPANQCVGMAIADSPYGPWEKVNGNGLLLNPPSNPNYWNYKARNGVVNPALLRYKGGYYLYFKSDNALMGLAIAEDIRGPYVQLPFPVTQNDRAIEDGYAFIYENQICLLTTDNHGILKKGGGILWKSDDGMNFYKMEAGFHLINEYVNPEIVKIAVWHYGSNTHMKFERPQILLKNGSPGWLYVASGCNIYGWDETVNYVLRFRGK